jgi:DNA replication protein DnaC
MKECPNRRLRYWDNSIGVSLEEAKTLDSGKFVQTTAVKEMKSAFDVVLERGYGWVYVYGKPGNGKTIMAKSLAVYSRQIKGYSTKYYKMSEMINWLRSSYDDEGGQGLYVARLKELKKIKCLVLDEVGRDRQTDFSIQTVSDIMDSRYEDAVQEKTITVWISNFSPEAIFEEYQQDRIRDARFAVLEISDSSRRRESNNQRSRDAWWHDF